MKRVSIYFLAFLTFWMSTWMVTDIHDWSLADADQAHPVFSAQQSHSVSGIQTVTQDHIPHCGVCSYDHGGHIMRFVPQHILHFIIWNRFLYQTPKRSSNRRSYYSCDGKQFLFY
jgi:hypothetical protein